MINSLKTYNIGGKIILKILSIDTSSKLCNVAILEDTTLIKKIELNNGLTHSESLMPLIKKILHDCNLKLADINLLVCDIGPGSFTGLRIGVATVKAFSDSLNIPCVGISSLEVLAYYMKDNGIVCTSIDARNDNCYFAIYEHKNSKYNVIEEPQFASNDYVDNLIKTKYFDKSIHFISDTDYSLSVEHLGIAGFIKFKSNNYEGEEISPLYLKKTQAEMSN